MKNKLKGFFAKNVKLILAFLISALSFGISRSVYFKDVPLFDVSFLGEAITGGVFFLLIFLWGGLLVKFIGGWIERIIVKTFYKVLTEFWSVQTKKLVTTLKRENRDDLASKIVQKSVILDTSVVIDGRILGVIKSGFLDNPIVVTQNVVDELQYMADRKNDLKRQKGRLGLDVLKDIKKAVGKNKFKVVNLRTKPENVDKSLVDLCKKTKSKIATVDFNLGKVAEVAGVSVLNINRLVSEIKSNLIPGEQLSVKLLQKGKEKGQAVGYLEDGTMIVVEDAKGYIGSEIKVVVDRVLQTDAGKMVFASIPVFI